VKALKDKGDGNASLMLQRGSSCSIPTGEEIKEAELYGIRSVQGSSFSAEIKHLVSGHHSGSC